MSAPASSMETYHGVWKFEPRRVVSCPSVESVAREVRAAAGEELRVRAMGRAYCWARHVMTRDVCLRLEGFEGIGAIDFQNRTVTVQAGVRLGDLTRALGKQGFCLPSLPFIDAISVGGAVATGAHGTSMKWGTLSDFVRSLTVVLASGEVRHFGVHSPQEELRAARLAIGMLGVIVELELEIIEMPWIRFSEFHLSLQAFPRQLPELLSRFDHLFAHWLPRTAQVRLECLESRSTAAPGFHAYVQDDNAFWRPPPTWFAMARRMRRALSGPLSQWPLSAWMRPAYEREVAPSQVRLCTQYGVALAEFPRALDALRSSAFIQKNADRTVEMKFLKGESRTFLGVNAEADSVHFNLWWVAEKKRRYEEFEGFETLMRALPARPHWGKWHEQMDTAYLEKIYPRWAAFEAVRKRLDPTGMFSIF